MNEHDYDILKSRNKPIDGVSSFIYPESLVDLGSIELDIIDSLVTFNGIYEKSFKKCMPIFDGVDFDELKDLNPLTLAMYGIDDLSIQRERLNACLRKLKRMSFYEFILGKIVESIVSKKIIKISKDYAQLVNLIDKKIGISFDPHSQEEIDQKVGQLYEMVSKGILDAVDKELKEMKQIKYYKDNREIGEYFRHSMTSYVRYYFKDHEDEEIFSYDPPSKKIGTLKELRNMEISKVLEFKYADTNSIAVDLEDCLFGNVYETARELIREGVYEDSEDFIHLFVNIIYRFTFEEALRFAEIGDKYKTIADLDKFKR